MGQIPRSIERISSCLDYFSIRHFTDILLFISFLLYIVLRFVKSILLNEYDDDTFFLAFLRQ